MNTIKQLPKKEIDAVNTVINFYLWYCINTKLLNQNDLVAFDNTLGYYILDSKHAESYLRILKNSGYVSEFFLETISDKFEEFNNYLNKQKFPKEEEMVGFEADLLLNSQDPDYNVKQEEVEVAEIQVLKESITIRFYAPTIKSELILGENDKWMIKNFTGY